MDGRRGSGTAKLVGLLVAVAVVVIGGGALLASQFRPGSPSEEVGPPTTVRRVQTSPTSGTSIPPSTTLPVASRFAWSTHETTEQLRWGQRLSLSGQTPLALVEHEGQLVLVTGAAPETRGSIALSGGQVWSSDDGVDWEHLFDFDADAVVVSAISTPFGIVAYGLDAASGDGVVWKSTDGRSWEQTVVAAGVPGTERWFEGAAATDEVIVIVGGVGPETGVVEGRVMDALREHYGPTISGFVWGEHVNWGSPGVDSIIVVIAPLGLSFDLITPTELGLTAADLRPPNVPRQATVWASEDGLTWSEVMPNGWTGTSVTSVGVGQWIRTEVYWPEGFAGEYMSTDGVTWERASDENRAILVQHWEGGIMAISRMTGELTFSNDGEQWRSLNLWGLLDANISHWDYNATDAGLAGIAAVVRPAADFDPPDIPAEFVSGDMRVLVRRHEVDIYSGSALAASFWRGSTGDPEGIVFDPATGSLTFLDPVDATPLLILSADELTELQQRIVPVSWQLPQGLLFSSAADWRTPGVFDAQWLSTEWIVQDLARAIGGIATHVHVGANQVLLVVSSDNGPHTQVLAAQVPQRP